jgi:FAD synthase
LAEVLAQILLLLHQEEGVGGYVTISVFDGIHQGHRNSALLGEAVSQQYREE